MHYVRQNVARQYAHCRYTKCLRRLDVFQLAQLERLAAQQTAQPCPTGNTENQAQEHQAQIGARRGVIEPLRMRIDDYLHHQHRCCDQQHTGYGTQHGIDILDHIIHPAAQISRSDAKQQSQRQSDQRGDGADDQPGADAFQRKVQHVLPDLVGAEHMILSSKINSHADQGRNDGGSKQQGAHRPASPCQPSLAAKYKSQSCHQPNQRALQSSPKHITITLLHIRQMRASVAQTRIVSRHFATRVADTFLGIQRHCQRRGISLLGVRAQRRNQFVERAQYLRCIHCLAAILFRQSGPIVQRIQ